MAGADGVEVAELVVDAHRVLPGAGYHLPLAVEARWRQVLRPGPYLLQADRQVTQPRGFARAVQGQLFDLRHARGVLD